MENITTAERNKMAATYGLLLGLIYMVLTTLTYMSSGSLMGFYGFTALAFVLYFVTMGIFCGRIRKADGGYIEFKDVFAAIIIMVFISCLISFVYNVIYMKYIDPAFMDKMKNTTIQFMEKNKVPDDQIEEAVRKFDKQAAEAKSFSIGTMLLTYFEMVVFCCLFGLIVAAIVKKKRPIFE